MSEPVLFLIHPVFIFEVSVVSIFTMGMLEVAWSQVRSISPLNFNVVYI